MALADLAAKSLSLLPPETAHRVSLKALASGLGPRLPAKADPVLATSIAGIELAHPVGLAAGYDKNGEAPDALLAAGFAFVELGAVTPRPQAGNPQPRLFRLRGDRAVINRMGFNNEGLDALKRRLEARAGKPGVVGINLGANKDSEDRAGDYVMLVKALKGLASFFTVNISSPNTPGLRDMQGEAALGALLGRVNDARWTEPVFLKVAPDLDAAGIESIVRVAMANRISGLIVSNTTLARPDSLKSRHKTEAGGLSGAPLTEASTEVLRQVRKAAGPDLPLIGVGGVNSVETAYAKIRAGASAIQLYTALVYEGPGLVGRLRDGLAARIRADGYTSLAEAVGVDA